MRSIQLLLLFLSSSFVVAAIATSSLPFERREDNDKSYIAAFESSGQCFHYLTEKKNVEKSKAPCKVYCRGQGGKEGNYGCDGSAFEDIPLNKIQPQYRDNDGNIWTPGKCVCNFELAEAILDVVMEGLADLDKYICLGMLEAFNSILTYGISFTPTGAVAQGAKAAVQGAKTFFENGLEASSFFGNWVGPACGVNDWQFDLFGALLNMPDSMGRSTGCHRKAKSSCKKSDAKPDTPKTARPSSKAADKTTQPPASSSNDACQLRVSRANGNNNLWEGKLGDPRTTTEDCGKHTRVLITETEKDIGFYETKITGIKCKKEWEQACYHYSSMMDVHKATRSMTEWTCGATSDTAKTGAATKLWGSAAIGPLRKTDEHWVWPWANGWVPRVVRLDANGNPKVNRFGHEDSDGCDRDEWPPRNFWPKDSVAHPKGMIQRIRFIPYQHNRGAGNLWGNFCSKHSAMSTKVVQNGPETLYVRDNLISTINKKVKVITGKDKTMTRITTVSVQTPRAIFSIDDWDGLKKDTDWYGLKENPCWPKDLVPDDPGWVLNTADEFYSQGQHPDLAKHTKSYRGLPDLQVLKNALAKHGGSPPHPFSQVDLNVWDTKKRIKMGDKEGEIPKEYRGVLPGNPKPKKRRMLFEESRRDNGTDFEQDDEPLDEDEDEGAFDEWENWKEYERLLRRAHFELAARTTPQRTEAEATPAGQGDATPTPAAQGSAVANEWPLPTN
ncbi:hypothetical protein CGCVW01_v010610 [Colletotrichum viniferum]|nr:hypothetical protein CGCVW01_v010610 [Colletotrichum viniferum]